MQMPGTLIEGDIEHRTRRPGHSFITEDETYVLKNDIEINTKTRAAARVISRERVALSGWAVNDAPKKQGHPSEYWVQATYISNNGNFFGVGVSEEVSGEVFFLGKLDCLLGTQVPVMLFTSDYTLEGTRLALCTDPKLWSSEYTAVLSKHTNLSVTAFTGLENAIQTSQDNLTNFEFVCTNSNDVVEKVGETIDSSNIEMPIPRNITKSSDQSIPTTIKEAKSKLLGFPGEIYVEVDRISKHAICTARTQHDDIEELWCGQLSCSLGDIIPVLPLAKPNSYQRPAICTAPDLWANPAYIQPFKDKSHAVDLESCLDIGKVIVQQAAHPDLSFDFPHIESIATHFSQEQLSITESSRTESAKSPNSICDDTEQPSESNSEMYNSNDNMTSDGTSTTSHTQNIEESVSEPVLTEEDTSYTETRRLKRDPEFRTNVCSAYENRCAICGKQRETPAGNPEVEAAHIYPKNEGGVDDVRNGIALCKLHHWAFDNGWLSISDNYDIIVKDAQERKGYEEFVELDGNTLHLPEDKELQPHPRFLQKHRDLHGFRD